MRSPITRRRPGLIGCALTGFVIAATFAVVPAARASTAQAPKLTSQQQIKIAYGSIQTGQSCASGPAINGNTSRQCNVPWNLVNTYGGGLGNLGQDCEIDFWMAGKVYFESFNGNAYATYGDDGQRLKQWTNQSIATGTRVVVEQSGHPGAMTVIKVHDCHKPWTGSHFLLMNESLSQEYGVLVCASVGKDAQGNNLTKMAIREACSYTDQVSLTEYGNAPNGMRYYLGSPYGEQSGPWVPSLQGGNNIVPIIHPAQWYNTWVFASDTDSTAYTVYESYAGGERKILYGPDPGDEDSVLARWQQGGSAPDSNWILVPVPWGW